jgi:hypothetical protein
MTFFYDLNKRLAALASKQDAEQISEDAKAVAPKSKLAESMEVAERATGDYSAKKARAGKDIGKPGKNFSKIAKGAAERYGSKAAGERVAGAVLNKLRHPKEDIENEGNAFTGALAKTPKGGKFKVGGKEFTDTSSLEEGTCPSCDCSPCKCDESMEESALQAYLGNKKYGKEGMNALRKAGREHAGKEKMAKIRSKYDKMDEADMEEGNAFTGALAKTPKGGKFKVGGKEFTDTSSLEEGFKEMDAWLAQREKEKGTGKFDVKDTGYSKRYTRKHEDDVDSDDAEVSTEPKRRGRPKSTKAKAPERVTKGAWKHKGERKVKENEVPLTDRGEYDDEAGMAKDSLHTIVRHAKELERALRSNENMPEWVQEKIGQIKGMMSSVTDYILSTHERDIEQATGREGITLEKAPPGAKAERMVKHIKKSLSKDGKLSDKDKAIAYATAWKAKKAGKVEEEGLEKHSTSALKAASDKDRKADQKSGVPAHFSTAQLKAELAKRSKVEEESTDKEDQRAEKAGKKVAKDIEYDEGHKSKDDNKAEKAGKKVTKDIEYDDKKDRKEKKEEKVDETTVAGSVATSTATPKASKGMQFGKGVYEGYNKKFNQALTESISVQENVEECGMEGGQPSITIQADGEEAAKLMALLKLAGLEGCPTCGKAPCGCESLEENSPDWPTDTETLDAEPNLRTYSGGLNGPKSTGQTTTPVIASQLRRQASMEESVELERSLFKTWKNYKG